MNNHVLQTGDHGPQSGFVSNHSADLPDGWIEVKVGDVVEKTGQRDPSRNPTKRFKYVDVSSVSNESLSITGYIEYEGKNAPSRARKAIKDGDVLFATVRPSLKRVATVPRELDDEICSTAFCVLRAKADVVDPEFLFFVTVNDSFVDRVTEHQRGSSYPAVTDNNIKEEFILLPPLAEQRAIAHVLRTVQRAKESTEKVIASTRQLKQSLMRHLFTHGPVPIDQADQVELKETEFGDVPADWRIAVLSDCAEVQTGIAKGRKVDAADAIMVPYLRVANVQDGFLDLTEIKEIPIRKGELERFALQVGDVLLTEGGDFDKLGRGFIWNGEVPTCVHQNHIFAVRANRQIISSDYLAYLTQSQYGKSYFLTVAHRTTHLACINTTKLKALPVPVPPLQGQEEIARLLKTIDRKYETEMHRRNALEGLLHTLLHGLMTGRIRLQRFTSGKA